MLQDFTPEWFAQKLQDRTTRGIARDTADIIRKGLLPVGTKLPPVRDLAYTLGVSPATLSEAWSELRKQKIITGRGRNGTWVSGDRFAAQPERLASFGNYGPDVLDLSKAIPDPLLLPSLDKALLHGARAQNLNSYDRTRILPELEEAVRRNWPYEPEAFLATNGGYNAVYTILHALLPPGTPVAIEDPTAMRLLDILEDLGVPIIPVACDQEGPLPDSLSAALQRKPSAFLFQPRTHSVTSYCVSAARMAALGDVLQNSDALIIEDDGVGDIAPVRPQTLGTRFPQRVIHILSYSKTLGPDLRLAVLSGSWSLVEQIQGYRSFSAGWTSRILQAAVAWLLKDVKTQAELEQTKQIYRKRARDFSEALATRGMRISGGTGLCCLVPVTSEPYAMVTLAARRIAVAPGAKFSSGPTSAIRVATSILKEQQADEVAEAVRLAADVR
ncbi:GntR family transcriptional regulator [Brucella endophytica]|uniref:GntR family transcriptional regulator n=1 Tax=Brucella endophytica TaxID=1963359 RepID=A0A916SMX5_9HYPH|nr:PLP-dependent aminotransferase family protein [Brucella endophytica]GGB06986.1 GntR family transcriptional regulator [Brucella endophytica]